MYSETNEKFLKTIQTIQRRRKQRHARLKEMAREEEGYSEQSCWARRTEATSDEVMCPVCNRGIRGDQEVINIHVDSCLVDESRKLAETVQDSAIMDDDNNWDDTLPDGAVGYIGNMRGALFTILLVHLQFS